MKKLLPGSGISILLFACASLLQGCLKDTATRTYTLYRPVYKSFEEVRAGIKSDAALPAKNPGKIFFLSNYIFLNEIDKGIHIIDNSNPSAPVNKYFIAIPGNLDLAVKGNTLYADNYRDLVTLDISNPANVQVKKITEKVFSRRQYLNGFFEDTTRVIVDWIKKDTTVSHEPARSWPNLELAYYISADAALISAARSSAPGVGGSMARFTLLNNYLYTVTQNDLNVFNITTPDNPVFANSINLGWGIETIYPFKNNLFIGSQSGMFIFNTTNPALPAQVSQFTHITSCDPVIADDNFAYVTLRSGTNCNGSSINQLDILNIQKLESTWLVKSYPLTNPHGLSKSGNTLFICDGTAGLKVYDATDVNKLRLLQTIKGIDAYDVIAQNNNAIVVAREGLYQYDYTNRSNVTLQSKISYINGR
ncbi:MAG TPA: hypothetical protein VK369_11515 [Segetibacter sp.]|nr:hypothetical protein [Segetibacter sp.]